MIKTLLVLLMLFSFSAAVQAEVYRCQTAQGGVAFQDKPCDGLAPEIQPEPVSQASDILDTLADADADAKVVITNNPAAKTASALATVSVPGAIQSASNPVAASTTLLAQQNARPPTLLRSLCWYLAIVFGVLAILSWVVPRLRMKARTALDGKERGKGLLAMPYRGYWWRGACAGVASLLAAYAILGTEMLALGPFIVVCALVPIGLSLNQGREVNFELLGEFDRYEREDFPDLYDGSSTSEYEIPADAPARIRTQCFASAVTTVFFYWGMSAFHFYSLLGNIVTSVSALLAFISAVMAVFYLALWIFLLMRDRAY